MRQSDQLDALAAALVEAQKEMPSIEKDATGHGYRYASLDNIMSKVRPVLAAHGLAVVQQPASRDADAMGLTTRLIHSSGQWIEETVHAPRDEGQRRNSVQAAGSTITYLRRYGIAALLGLADESDTDGTQPQRPQRRQRDSRGPTSPQAQATRASKRPSRQSNGATPDGARTAEEVKAALIAASMDGSAAPASDKQLKYARSSIGSLVENDADKAKLLLYHVYGLDSSSELSKAQASALIDWIGCKADNDYTPSETAQTEASRLLRAFEVERGQGELALDDEAA